MVVLATGSLLRAEVTGSISGTVTDASGALMPNVQIQLIAAETGVVRVKTTNPEGFYNFFEIPPGHFDIVVHSPGFAEYRQSGVLLDVNSARVINIRLAVSATSQDVHVNATEVGIDTAASQMGQVISEQTMTSVPLATRSYTDLLALQPGVAPTSAGLAGGQSNQFQSAGFTFTPVSGDLNAGNLSVNGQRESANGFLLNGTTVQEFAFSGTAAIPNLDSIHEFRIITNNFDAEYGGYAGGQINVITKSGTNRYHGSAFEFLRNTDLDARNYFAQQRDDYKQNQFGVTVGGPVRHDKLFFFADYQGNRVVIGQSALGVVPVPSSAERSGDFSGASPGTFMTGAVQGPAWASELSARMGKAVTQGEPYYFAGCGPATCVFPGAQIPLAAFAAPSPNLLKYIPPVNATASDGSAAYSPVALPQTIQDNKTSGRIDDNSRFGLLSAYYFFDEYSEVGPNPFTPDFGSNYYGRTQVVNLSDTKPIGNSAVNEARIGFVRLNYAIHVPTGGGGITPASLGFEEGPDTLGISPSVPQYAHVPQIDFNNFSIGSSGAPLDVIENTYQFIDNFSKVIRTHTLKLGAAFRYSQLTEIHLGSNGDFGFNGSETGIDFADFLIGAPQSYSQGQGYPSYGRNHYIGLFAQDSWRVNPSLTLNYGLRWDVSTPWSELHNEMETLVPGLQSQVFPGAPTGWVFPGDPGVPSTLAPTRYDNLAPRAGLAYSPNATDGFFRRIAGEPGKSVIRAGFGRFYDTFEGASTFNENGDAPFGNYYGSPVPPEFATPFVDRGTGHSEGQRFPAPPPPFDVSPGHPDNSINWANYLPISSSPGFWHKNVLPYTEEYELSLERQLGAATIVTASYVGAQGHHLLSSMEANPGTPDVCLSVSMQSQVMAGTQPCGPNGENGIYSPAAGGTINGTRTPFGNSFGSNGYFITNGKSSYNSLQLSVKEKLSSLSFLAGYTYGKSLDNASGYGEQINFLDPRERFLSAFDVRNNFVLSYDWNLPFDRLGGPKRLTGGWQLTGITRFATGLPVTLYETDDRSLLGTSSPGAISTPIDSPSYNGAALHIRDPRSNQPYFDVSAFSLEPLGQLGSARRRFFAGPGINNFDMALLKNIPLKDSLNVEFRAETFNLFNHAQFGLPNGNINADADFGTVTTANSPRIMQLALKLAF